MRVRGCVNPNMPRPKCQSCEHETGRRLSAAPIRTTPLPAEPQPVKRGAALRRGFAALQTLNDLCVVVTCPAESVAVIVNR